MRRSAFLVLLAAALLNACVGANSIDSIPAEDSWITLDADKRFSLRAPPGTTYRPLMGIDQFVGEFVYTAFDIQFGLGSHNPRLEGFKRDYAARPLHLEGIEAEAIIYTAKGSGEEGDCENTWVGLLTGPLGPPRVFRDTFRGVPREVRFPPDTLHMLACLRTAREIEAVQQIYATVRFPDRP